MATRGPRCALILAVAILVSQASSSAFAEPAGDAPCTVTIVAAPEPVRAVVEAWVAAERRCSRTLQLRIEVDGAALHVYARDDRGNVRERVVPDAPSVGALVASWIADDAPALAEPALAEPAAPPAPLPAEPAPVAPPPPAPEVALPPLRPAPSEAAHRFGDLGSRGLTATLTPPARPAWLSLVAALSVSETRKFGLRADLDLVNRRRWSAGAFAAQLENGQRSLGIAVSRAGGFVAVETAAGDWQLRTQAGLGGTLFWVRNYCNCEQMGVPARVHRLTLRPISELAVLIGHRLGARWSFAGGAMITATLIDEGLEMQDRVSVMMFAGFRNRL